MIVVFLVDTSASMNQKFSNGMTLLECTKSAIEHLVKHMSQVKAPERSGDKFMLVTYDEVSACVKSSLKDPLPHLIKELKILRANDTSNPGPSLSVVFDIINKFRVCQGIDTPAIMNIPGITSAGAEYYMEPFRWDQRLYTLFLEPLIEATDTPFRPGTYVDTIDPQLSLLSQVMGGTNHRVRTLRHLLQAMDCMLGISKMPPTPNSPQAVLNIYGVTVKFENMLQDPQQPSTANHHQLIYINPNWLNPQSRHQGFFPIPEAFWPDLDAQRPPTRTAQPTLYYHARDERNVDIPERFPFDKYVIAPCPMTQELLMRPPGSCWPVHIKNSYRIEGFGFPFGFLKANTNKNAVTLTVVAYNYPALFTLLGNLNLTSGRVPTGEWRRDFAEYLSHTPPYYYTAKSELIRVQSVEPSATADPVVPKKRALCANAFDVPRSDLVSVLTDLKIAFFKELQLSSSAALPPTPHNSTIQPSMTSSRAMSTLLPPPRLDALIDSDDLHSLPIADMGIYQDRMQKLQRESLRDPLRDEESLKSLQRTMFGNPYKQEKKTLDSEDDEASAGNASVSSNSSSNGSSWSSILGRKRKPRRRSVSPSPFPIEKIPSLAHSDRSVSGMAQTVYLGQVGTKAPYPLLKIAVQHGWGKAQSSDDGTEGLGRHMVMHDGEDEDDSDDDFRRAMFNSDEMELDGDDEAARLRADTPMPGGIGLDDDDENMEDMQSAQELIPAPITSVNLEDIKPTNVGSRYHPQDGAVANTLAEGKQIEQQQGIKEDLDHLDGSAKPVFESLVYDPSALMELQTIPHMIPERASISAATAAEAGLSNGLGGELGIRQQNVDGVTGSQDLMPIAILSPPSTTKPSSISKPDGVVSPDSDAEASSVAIDYGNGAPFLTSRSSKAQITLEPSKTAGDSALSGPTPTDTIPLATAPSLPPTSVPHEPWPFMKQTHIEFRNSVVKQLKMGPTGEITLLYNESTVLDMITKVNAASNWTREQKLWAVMGCLAVAKGFRRMTVVAKLETLQNRRSTIKMSSPPPPSGQQESLSPSSDKNDLRNIIRNAKKNQNETVDATVIGAAVVLLRDSVGFSQQVQENENADVYKRPAVVATVEAEAAVLVWIGVVVYNQPVQEYEIVQCAVAVQRENPDRGATCAGIKVEAEATTAAAAAASKMTGIQPRGSIVTGAPGKIWTDVEEAVIKVSAETEEESRARVPTELSKPMAAVVTGGSKLGAPHRGQDIDLNLDLDPLFDRGTEATLTLVEEEGAEDKALHQTQRGRDQHPNNQFRDQWKNEQRAGGRGEGRGDTYIPSRGRGNDDHRGQRYESSDYRRNDSDDHQRRDDQPYRGGRRAQAMLPEFSNSRHEERMAIKFSIWAPSPTEEELRNRSPSPDREVKKKPSKSKKYDSDAGSDSDDSTADRKRRRKSSKKSKEKRSRSSRHKSSSGKRSSGRSSKRRRRSVTPSSGSDDDEKHGRSTRSKRREDSASRSRSRRRDQPVSAGEDSTAPKNASMPTTSADDMEFPDDMWVEKKVEMPEDDQEVGPVPLQLNDGMMNERNYGGALLAGEGSAMAAYVQDGKRIPRRGEIGLESNEIENYEGVGFVMSGSRHQRMNAVRVRKENQVISAEEKRALLIFNQEEKIKKDNKIINEMREMVASKLRSTGHSV
ncbi:Integrator complex subunit 6 [Mortierella polycephala]|uniref:Integrator complex subunit 6 n=1 Tax=Mortierella polycephala TaxID=41804 RepID=A0A9P6U5Y6_9FUNG|nr:Integrator complex subunit 6 [Mortierella polycephala]